MNKPKEIVGVIFGIIGTIFSVISFLSRPNWQAILSGIILLFVIIFFILYYIKEYCKNEVVRYNSKDKIITFIKEAIRDNEVIKILYYGGFDEDILNSIHKTLPVDDNNKKVSLLITTGGIKKKNIGILDEMINRNNKSENSQFSYQHSIEKSLFNYFIYKKANDFSEILLFFNLKSTYYGYKYRIYEDIFPNYEQLKKNTFSINLKEQLPVLEYFMITLTQLKIPLQRGYFKHIIPPFELRGIRDVWQREILSSFNSYSLGLIQNDKKKVNSIKITWNITESSKDDLVSFEGWLSRLNEKSEKNVISITRYLFINMNGYKTNDKFKQTVDEILNKYFTSHRYKCYYLDSYKISKELVNDYSIFHFENGDNIIQESVIDTEYTPRVLKVYFSKDYERVNIVESYFKELDNIDSDDKTDSFSALCQMKL